MFAPGGPTLAELARQALSSTEGGYDLLAPKFDHTPYRTPAEVLEAVVPYLGPPVDRAVDLCCGTGAGIEILRPLCREEVVGIDFSRGMLDEARPRFPDAEGQAAVRLVRGDVLALDSCAEYGLATCWGALGHIVGPAQLAFLARVHRALVPGGRFVLVTRPRPAPWRRAFWEGHGFNAAMRVRNAVVPPPFVMYYLQWPLRRTVGLLGEAGFATEVRSGVLPGPWRRYAVVVATRPGRASARRA